MKLLIDTHVFIWLINGHKGVGSKAYDLVTDPDNDVCISYLSLFEVVIKAQTGRATFSSEIIDRLAEVDVTALPLDHGLLHSYHIIDARNKDPFDNAIIATAIQHDLTLVTSDSKILACQMGIGMVDARL
ncbi:type II toxin-antitoxin system VapC family toxin [Candidatus Saccharibacteria bacterium]|nr:type II toxin-antitoxin system VapC family toxin [Candidatus Saccharibacteria bacterium]